MESRPQTKYRQKEFEHTRDGFDIYKDVVIDSSTGLVWARDTSFAGKGMSWSDAVNWVNAVSIGGYDDWSLPSKNELAALAKRGGANPTTYLNQIFDNIEIWYWCSDRQYGPNSGASIVGTEVGNVGFDNLGSNNHVWPVRHVK